MLDCLPERVEPVGLADAGRSFRGELEIRSLRRLAPLLADQDGKLHAQIEFRLDERCIRVLQGQVEGQIQLTCQRCLEPVKFAVNVAFVLGIVGSENEIAGLPEGYEPLMVDGEPQLTSALIEDEILLAVPAVPVHTDNQACNSGYRNQQQQVRDNPFSILEKLKH
ncbi:COG1399 protein, clustered with ribosomal protein L32p [hydrothermal vent metagenome]|uniref:Large ribosomal RNA subunit accumulation protein YceD n=1 Tax=hydrothermal vent metagenome TaxID=652676 RepID=A0A3B0Y8G4_9ZZZZ